ncbi:hypothetical protein AB0K00_34190 [Dactylosporangium sp. NPDC049525]|uniref:hypothetical protein n=1 Tax=Dactylosporangium sp. NPDC049525 TaxID=3154730 RepID=UPI0034327935
MNLFRRGASADTTAHRSPTRTRSRTARRLVRLVTYGILTGTGTALGQTAVTALIWWWTHSR